MVATESIHGCAIGPIHVEDATSGSFPQSQSQQTEGSDAHSMKLPLHLEMDPLEVSGLGPTQDIELDNPVFPNSGKSLWFAMTLIQGFY